jgi:hypothetical protein
MVFGTPRGIDTDQIENWFKYHPPVDQHDIDAYNEIRAAGKVFAQTIVAFCPAGADTTTAIRKVREAVMTANSAIACGGK